MTKKITKKSEQEKVVTKSHILKPRMTEKASLQSNANAFTFVVNINATKLTVAAEIKSKHGVSPVKVNITNLPAKRVIVKGRHGVQSGLKKAIVFLKKGDTLKLA